MQLYQVHRESNYLPLDMDNSNCIEIILDEDDVLFLNKMLKSNNKITNSNNFKREINIKNKIFTLELYNNENNKVDLKMFFKENNIILDNTLIKCYLDKNINELHGLYNFYIDNELYQIVILIESKLNDKNKSKYIDEFAMSLELNSIEIYTSLCDSFKSIITKNDDVINSNKIKIKELKNKINKF